MRVGVGLPNTVAGCPAPLLPRWAAAAERAGVFCSLGAHDRLAWDGIDALTALAAAAGVTQAIELASLVAIAPLRGSAAMLGKQAATIAGLAGPGRLTLGLGVGPRRDDYEAAGVAFSRRGRIFDEQLAGLPEWLDPAGVPIMIGGGGDAALVRLVRHGQGYCHGGGPPRAFATAAERARIAWSDSGRPGRPRLLGLGYFALGREAVERGRRELHDYYAFTGAFADRIAAGLLDSGAAVAELARGYREAGCDDLVLFPAVAELDQLERLAEVVAGIGEA